MVRNFDLIGNYDLEPVRSVYDYPLEVLLHVPNVNDVVEQELTSVGWDGVGTVFGVYHSGSPESSFRLRVPSGVFTSEMSEIFVAFIQIRARRPD
jgi:hypothetical protein